MPNSIQPVTLTTGESFRIDPGSRWFREFQWLHDGLLVDLSKATLSAEVRYRSGFGPGFGVGNGGQQGAAIAEADIAISNLDAAIGLFEIEIPETATAAIEQSWRDINLTLVLYATFTAELLGYQSGERARLASFDIVAAAAASIQSTSVALPDVIAFDTNGGTLIAQDATPAEDQIVDTYDDLPDPTSVPSGTIFRVINDPLFAGQHMAIGPAGQPATHFQQI